MLSILLASRNNRDVLPDCLRSIPSGAKGLKYETILVDNASDDGTVELIKQEFPQVKLLRNNENLGFGRANNQGLAASTGEYALFLNCDTLVPEGSLHDLVEFLDAHNDAGACSPRLLQKDGRTQPFAFGGDPTPGYLFRRGIKRLLFKRSLHDWNTTHCQEVDWVSGACLLVRREAFEQVGGFDKNFFMYFEDNDLCLRLRRAGWRVYYDPEVSITHLGGASTRQSSQRSQWYDASLRYFYAKYYSPLERIFLEIMLPFYRRIS